jgi:hypothetical protein
MNKDKIREQNKSHLESVSGNDLSNNQITAEDVKQAMTGGDSVDVANAMKESESRFRDTETQSHGDREIQSRKNRALTDLAKFISEPILEDINLLCGIPDIINVISKVKVSKLMGHEKRKMQSYGASKKLIAFKDAILKGTLVTAGKYYNREWFKKYGNKAGVEVPEDGVPMTNDFFNSIPVPDRNYISWSSIKRANTQPDKTAITQLSINCPLCNTANIYPYDMSGTKFLTGKDVGLNYDSENCRWVKEVQNPELGVVAVLGLVDGNTQNKMLKLMSQNKTDEGLLEVSADSVISLNGVESYEFESKYGMSIKEFLSQADNRLTDWLDSEIQDMTPGPIDRINFMCINEECTYNFDQEVSVESFLFQTMLGQTQSSRGR